MNYEKHYRLLCSNRQQLNRKKLAKTDADYEYYELHHIVPRHEAGNDEASNLVLLTAREHFIAHWLFAKWKRTSKAWAALACMSWQNGRRLTARQIEIAKAGNAESASLQVGELNPVYGKCAKARIAKADKTKLARFIAKLDAYTPLKLYHESSNGLLLINNGQELKQFIDSVLSGNSGSLIKMLDSKYSRHCRGWRCADNKPKSTARGRYSLP